MTNDRKITISVGASRKSTQWQRQTLLVSELYDRLSLPVRSQETMATYLSLSKGRQDDLKDVGGFVAGTLNGPRRKADAVIGRDVLTLDLDNIPPFQTEAVLKHLGSLGPGYCVYSTRKHRPDAPRLRILIPLDRTATAEEYEAVARRAAEWIGMDWMDPSTFEPSRLMYWGSCCSDGSWVFYTADKPFLSVDATLDTYSDWHDMTAWPRAMGEASPSALARRQTDPETKNGVVGAFCRCYNVVQAMDLIPGAYDPCGEGRYTYTGGSTTGGAVTYDEDKFLYSHHATDPCGGQLVNAWDLVRLHKFGHLDDEASQGSRGNTLPSFRAMSEYAVQDAAVSGLLADERWQRAQEAFTRAAPEAPAEGLVGASEEDDGTWRRPPMMQFTEKGAPDKTVKNYLTALKHDLRLKGKLRLNLFTGRIDVTGALPWARPVSTAVWTDDDAAQLRVYLEAFFGKLAKNDLLDALAAAASDQAYHPVRDYLTALAWDGTPRLDTLLIDYLGAADTRYTRAVTRKAFTAAAARVMAPGCKYDTMLVLVGRQGRHKSSLLAKMGGAWFSDSLRTFGDKDAMETIQGTWINEVAELQAMNKADINAVKMFLSKTNDYFRAAYGRYTADRPRQCVFFGTTNSAECLTDQSGGRRFWPVDIDKQARRKDVFRDLDGERDQLWAEAVRLWKNGEPLFLPTDLEALAKERQEAHRAHHPWEDLIHNFLDQPVPAGWHTLDLEARRAYYNGGLRHDGALEARTRVCALEIWCEALDKRKGDMRKADSREINEILENTPGWARAGTQRTGDLYGRQRCFDRLESVNKVTEQDEKTRVLSALGKIPSVNMSAK